MPRLQNAVTGVIVNVDDETAATLEGYAPYEASTADDTGYGSLKVADLKAEVERRNEGRDEDRLLPLNGKKVDLIAALEADDESAAGQTE